MENNEFLKQKLVFYKEKNLQKTLSFKEQIIHFSRTCIFHKGSYKPVALTLDQLFEKKLCYFCFFGSKFTASASFNWDSPQDALDSIKYWAGSLEGISARLDNEISSLSDKDKIAVCLYYSHSLSNIFRQVSAGKDIISECNYVIADLLETLYTASMDLLSKCDSIIGDSRKTIIVPFEVFLEVDSFLLRNLQNKLIREGIEPYPLHKDVLVDTYTAVLGVRSGSTLLAVSAATANKLVNFKQNIVKSKLPASCSKTEAEVLVRFWKDSTSKNNSLASCYKMAVLCCS